MLSRARGAGAASGVRGGILPLLFLGLLAGVQGADPNIASTALLSASDALHLGPLDAIAASINTLMVAATVITTGMMADRWGRRRVLAIALLLAAAGDVIAATALAPSPFIAGRGIAGIGLGAVFGASFAYVKVIGERRKGGLAGAIGVYSAALGAAALALTFIGSSLVGVDWRAAFLFVPIVCALCVPLAFVLLPRDEAAPASGPWDVLGQALLGLGIVLSLYGISHATNGLTDPLTIWPFLGGVALLGLWVWRESTDPDRRFFPISLFRNRVFLAAIVAGLLYNLTSGVVLLAFSNLFQYSFDVHGLALSLAQLPYLLAAIPASLLAGNLLGSGRVSRRALLVVGAIVIAIGAVLFAVTALARPDSILAFVPALVVIGLGVIVPSVPYGSMILGEADAQHYGVVSSSRTTIGQYWFSLGLAGATIVLDSVTRARLGDRLGATAVTELNTYAASGTKPSDGDVLTVAAEVYVDAFAVLMFVLAAVVVVGGAIAWLLLRRDRPVSAASAASPD